MQNIDRNKEQIKARFTNSENSPVFVYSLQTLFPFFSFWKKGYRLRKGILDHIIPGMDRGIRFVRECTWVGQ